MVMRPKRRNPSSGSRSWHPCAILSMVLLTKARELASVRESGDLRRMQRAEVEGNELLEGLKERCLAHFISTALPISLIE